MAHKRLNDFVSENCINERFIVNVNRLQEITFEAENTKKSENEYAWKEAQDALTTVLNKYGFMDVGTYVQLDCSRQDKRRALKDCLTALGANVKGVAIDRILDTMESMTGKVRRKGTEKSGYIGTKRQRTAGIDIVHGLLQYCAEHGFISYVVTKKEYEGAEKIEKYRKHGFNILVG